MAIKLSKTNAVKMISAQGQGDIMLYNTEYEKSEFEAFLRKALKTKSSYLVTKIKKWKMKKTPLRWERGFSSMFLVGGAIALEQTEIWDPKI